jgi:hypothetical protein
VLVRVLVRSFAKAVLTVLPRLWCTHADIEDFGGMQQNEKTAEGTADAKAVFYGIACTVQGGATSVIRNNKVLMMGGSARNESIVERSEFVYIGIPKVNYGKCTIPDSPAAPAETCRSVPCAELPCFVLHGAWAGVGMINVIGNAIRGANSTADTGLKYATAQSDTELVMVSALNLVEGVGVQRVVAPEGVRMTPGL